MSRVVPNGKGYEMSTIDNADFVLMANLAISDGFPAGKVCTFPANFYSF